MRYTIRPGVTAVSICGVKALIPDRQAAEYCLQPLRLKTMGAILWDCLEKGKVEDAYKVYAILSKKNYEEASRKVDTFYAKLAEDGFLIAGERE